MNNDFKRGFMLALGVVAAMYVFGIATGVLKKVV